jgi:hypothetical protein
MKTEYKFGLGRDRRELSYYQSGEWMRAISQYRKGTGPGRGELHPRCKMKARYVLFIRGLESLSWAVAEFYASFWRVTPEYLFQLRKTKKRWSHI